MKLTKELIESTFAAGNMTEEQRTLLLGALQVQEAQEAAEKEQIRQHEAKNAGPVANKSKGLFGRFKKGNKEVDVVTAEQIERLTAAYKENVFMIHDTVRKACKVVDKSVGVGCTVVDIAANVTKLGIMATGCLVKEGVSVSGRVAHKINDAAYEKRLAQLNTKEAKTIEKEADELLEQYL